MKHYFLHRFITVTMRIAIGWIVKRVMGYKCAIYKGPDVPTLIIANHNSDIDPAFVAMGITRQTYFLASEHSFRAGFPSKIMKAAFAPIPINKTVTDVSAIKEMMRRLKAGANVCLFAEGNRSFSGKTAPIGISAAKLAKRSGADLMTFRIEGGYFTTPRWAGKKRKGEMTGAVVNVYAAADLKGMTDEQVLDAIERDIHEDAYELQKERQIRYRGKNLAENIETALYLCPGCKGIGTIASKGDSFSCGCGLSGIYTETGFLEGESLPFSTITEWCEWQKAEMEVIAKGAGGGTICSDAGQRLYAVRAAVDKTLVGEGEMRIDRETFHCAGFDFPLDQIISFAVAGQMTLLFALKSGTVYDIRSTIPRSALKYRDLFRILTGRGE